MYSESESFRFSFPSLVWFTTGTDIHSYHVFTFSFSDSYQQSINQSANNPCKTYYNTLFLKSQGYFSTLFIRVLKYPYHIKDFVLSYFILEFLLSTSTSIFHAFLYHKNPAIHLLKNPFFIISFLTIFPNDYRYIPHILHTALA